MKLKTKHILSKVSIFIGYTSLLVFYTFNIFFMESILILPLLFITRSLITSYYGPQKSQKGKDHLMQVILLLFFLGIFLLEDTNSILCTTADYIFTAINRFYIDFWSVVKNLWVWYLTFTGQHFYIPNIIWIAHWNLQDLIFQEEYVKSLLSNNMNTINHLPFYLKENISFYFLPKQLDSLSLMFIYLVLFLSPLCIFWIWEDKYLNENKFFYVMFLALTWALLGAFSTFNFFLFFIYFECLLIPMFLLVILYGSRYRKMKAAYYLVFYTLVGSVLLFFSIGILLSEFGTTDLVVLQDLTLNNKKQTFIWILMFFGFAVKLPLFPLHIWLPEAHVEAPTVGSVILAAFLLKLGGYGLIRWVVSILPFGSIYMMPLVTILSLLGLIYCALTALRQLDIKKMIAYSSISHMNLGVLGIFSFTLQGLQGSIYLMLAHGIVSAALFFLIGSIYDRYHTKNLLYIGGVALTMPAFAVFIFLFSIANFSFPGTPNFIAELLILLGILKNNFLLFFLSSLGVFFSTCFSILLTNKLLFGSLKSQYNKKFQDLSRREVFVLVYLLIFTLVLGFNPTFLLNYSTFYCKKIILLMLL